MGFGYFMYSHSLVPVIDLWVRVVTKLVSEQWFSLMILKLSFCVFLHYCGIRLSNVSFVIIASSIIRCMFVIVFDFIWFVFSEWEVEQEMLLLLKQLIMLSSLFRAKLLLLLLDVEEEVAVVEECCLMLYMFWAWFFLWLELLTWLYVTLIDRDI